MSANPQCRVKLVIQIANNTNDKTKLILLDLCYYLNFSNTNVRYVPLCKMLMVWINAELHGTNISQNSDVTVPNKYKLNTAVWQEVWIYSGATWQVEVVIIYLCVVCEWESGSLAQLHHQCAWLRPRWSFGLLWVRPWQTAAAKHWGCWKRERWGGVSGEVFFHVFIAPTVGADRWHFRPQTFIRRSGSATSTVTFNVSKILKN